MAHDKLTKKVSKSWSEMKQRCNNPHHNRYYRYGGRGIKYDKSWESFENFYNDMGASYIYGYSIDRIDNDGNYCKENCKWSSRKEQCRNRSTNRLITYGDTTKKLVEWSELLGIKRSTITQRLDYYNWTVERALSK